MANIQVFEYQNSKVRTVDMDGEAWFVLKDVCAVLGISNNRMAADRLDDDEKGVSLIDTLGGKQEMLYTSWRRPQALSWWHWHSSIETHPSPEQRLPTPTCERADRLNRTQMRSSFCPAITQTSTCSG